VTRKANLFAEFLAVLFLQQLQCCTIFVAHLFLIYPSTPLDFLTSFLVIFFLFLSGAQNRRGALLPVGQNSRAASLGHWTFFCFSKSVKSVHFPFVVKMKIPREGSFFFSHLSKDFSLFGTFSGAFFFLFFFCFLSLAGSHCAIFCV